MISILVVVWIAVGVCLVVGQSLSCWITISDRVKGRQAMKGIKGALSGFAEQMKAEMAAKDAEDRARRGGL